MHALRSRRALDGYLSKREFLVAKVLFLENMATYNRGPFFLGYSLSFHLVEVVDAEEEPISNRAVTR